MGKVFMLTAQYIYNDMAHDLAQVCIADDALFAKCQENNRGEAEFNTDDYLFVPEFVANDVLDGKFNAWNSGKLPIRTNTVWDEHIHNIYPGWYIDDITPGDGPTTYYPVSVGGKIINNLYYDLWFGSSAGCWLCPLGRPGNTNKEFPGFQGSVYITNSGVKIYSYPVVIMPESDVSEDNKLLLTTPPGRLTLNIDLKSTGTSKLAWYFDEPIFTGVSVYKNMSITTIDVNPDPYKPGGGSGLGGGGGDFDNTSTPVDIPVIPQIAASDTGFITLYNPSTSQLKELANYMWSDLFDLEGWKKIFADPMDAILGLSVVPVSVPAGGARAVTVGNISTGVTLTTAASQYVTVDCGEINVKEYWGAYLDYEPYTKAEIYLPYIGTHAIAVDDIMGKTVHVVYHVDILSGACCAYVKCGESVLYSFVGQCSCSIPITGSDWTNVINGALSIAGSIGSMVATGGASAPMALGTMASASVNNLKPSIEKSGSMGGMGGMLGIQVPYLILTRPRQALPENQNRYTGYPSFVTMALTDCKGYTEIESVHLEGIPATQEEISEIESLLKGGVIF